MKLFDVTTTDRDNPYSYQDPNVIPFPDQEAADQWCRGMTWSGYSYHAEPIEPVSIIAPIKDSIIIGTLEIDEFRQLCSSVKLNGILTDGQKVVAFSGYYSGKQVQFLIKDGITFIVIMEGKIIDSTVEMFRDRLSDYETFTDRLPVFEKAKSKIEVTYRQFVFKVKAWAVFIATDVSGSVHIFDQEPEFSSLTGQWTSEGEQELVGYLSNIPMGAADSLVELQDDEQA